MENFEIPYQIGIEKAVMDVIWWDFIGFEVDTRAIFRAVNVRSASERGFDAFLHFTYGVTFVKGEYWYENPDPYAFLQFLIEKVMQGGKLLDKQGLCYAVL